MSKNREHIVRLCLAPELRVGLIKFQAEKEVSDSYGLLQLITKGLYQEKKISREVYEVFMQRYSRKLVTSVSEPKLTGSELKSQQKLEELRRWFESVKAEFFKDHRPLASGKSWCEYVLGEAEKYKDTLPIAAEVLELGSRLRSG
jgi:hypothetical protein